MPDEFRSVSPVFWIRARRAVIATSLVGALTLSTRVSAREPATVPRKQQDPAAIVRQVHRGLEPSIDANGCLILPDNGLLNPTTELNLLGLVLGETPPREAIEARAGELFSDIRTIADVQAALADYVGDPDRGTLEVEDSYGPSHHVDFYDWDDDGDLDAFVGLKNLVEFEENDAKNPFDDEYLPFGWGTLVYFENVTGEESSPFPEDHTYFRPIVDGSGPLGPFIDAAIADANRGGVGVDRGSWYIGSPAPVLADLDEDDVPELYVGDMDGHVRRYLLDGEGEVRGEEPQYDPDDFDFLRDPSLNSRAETVDRGLVPLDAIDVGQNAVPAFYDFDGDGTTELFVGRKGDLGIGLRGEYEPIFMYYQASLDERGLVDLPLDWVKSDPEENPFTNADVFGYTAPTFVDIDGDTDIDAFVGAKSGLHYFENVAGEGVRGAVTTDWVQRYDLSHPLLGAQAVFGGTSPAFADIDDDGDLDYFAGSKTIDFIENRGTETDPAFLDMGSSPEFVDLDGDGDLDVIAGGKLIAPVPEELPMDERGPAIFFQNSTTIVYFENVGTAEVPVWERRLGDDSPVDGLVEISLETDYPFAAADTIDIDGDGDFDLFVGTKTEGLLYFENVGTPNAPEFVAAPSPFAEWNQSPLRGPEPPEPEGGFFEQPDPFFVDLDGDGDYDAVVGDKGVSFDYRLRYFENLEVDDEARGDGPLFVERLGDPEDAKDGDEDNPFYSFDGAGAPWLVDYDFDGDYDLFVGAKSPYGLVAYVENQGTPDAPSFSSLGETAFWLARTEEIFNLFLRGKGDDPWAEGSEFPGVGFSTIFDLPFPAVVDIDADGDYDGFIGSVGRDEAFRAPGGLIVDPKAIVTSETGEFADIEVSLASQPLGTVPVSISVSDMTEAELSTTMLEFTPENWDTPQTVTVTGLDDALTDGDIAYQVIFRAFPPLMEGKERGTEPPCAEVVVEGINADEEARGAVLIATKEVFGASSNPGDTITYEIVLTNVSGVVQPDLMGPEFEDTLPPELLLLSADATSGAAGTSGNTVTWNGSIPPGGSVIISIDAEILAEAGTEIVNQGVASFDGEPKGMNNDSSVLSDDPNEPGIADETVFVVGGPIPERGDDPSPLEIPTISQVGRWAMGALLALFALVGISRQRP